MMFYSSEVGVEPAVCGGCVNDALGFMAALRFAQVVDGRIIVVPLPYVVGSLVFLGGPTS
jgi:hypothetical protein